MEQAGSEKKYSFCIPPRKETNRVAVYEACIDALAHMTLEEGKQDKYRLSLGGNRCSERKCTDTERTF